MKQSSPMDSRMLWISGVLVVLVLVLALIFVFMRMMGAEETRVQTGHAPVTAEPVAPEPDTVSPEPRAPSSPSGP